MDNQPIETNPPSFDSCAVLFCFMGGFWLFACFVGSLALNIIREVIK